MKADDRILSAARKAKGCPFRGSSRVRQPWQDLKASRALKTRPFPGPKVRILLPPAVSPLRTRILSAEHANVLANLTCRPAGRFHGPMVVTMRPIPAALVQMASELTARYPHAHGAPLHVGSPDAIGIADLGRPDYGDPVPDEVPVFWACHAWACVHRGDSTPCRPNSQRFRQSCAIQLSAAVPLDSIILLQ
jgi:hypothetical protein